MLSLLLYLVVTFVGFFIGRYSVKCKEPQLNVIDESPKSKMLEEYLRRISELEAVIEKAADYMNVYIMHSKYISKEQKIKLYETLKK